MFRDKWCAVIVMLGLVVPLALAGISEQIPARTPIPAPRPRLDVT
jgi:hypothetical protein